MIVKKLQEFNFKKDDNNGFLCINYDNNEDENENEEEDVEEDELNTSFYSISGRKEKVNNNNVKILELKNEMNIKLNEMNNEMNQKIDFLIKLYNNNSNQDNLKK